MTQINFTTMKKILLSAAFAIIAVSAFAQQSDFFQSTLVRVCTFGPDKKLVDYKEHPNSTVFEVNLHDGFIKHHKRDGGLTMSYIYDMDHEEDSPAFMFFGRDAVDNSLINYCLNWEDKTMFIMMNDSETTGYLFYWSKNWR